MWTVSWASLAASAGFCPALLSLLPGREAGGSATQRPWGMTHVIRQARGLHGQTARSHPSIPWGSDRSPQRHPELRQGAVLSQRAHTALPQAWSPGGEGSPGSGQSHWAELATPRPGCPAAPYHHPRSRVSTGMTLLIPADPDPSCLLALSCVCAHVCLCARMLVCEHTFTHTHTASPEPLLTWTPQLCPAT